MTACVVYVDNTNLVELSGLKSAIEDDFISDATVTLTVKDAEGTNVTGQTWPTTLASIDGTDPEGNYRGIIEDDVALTAGATYYAHIDANAGANRIGHWEFAFVAKIRRAT